MKNAKHNILKSGYVRKTERKIGPMCRGNCEKLKGTKCSILTQDDRLNIFEEFWSKYCKKKERHKYLSYLIENSPSENDMPIYKYHLLLNNERIRVCREMFLNTLGISIKMLKFPKENSKLSKEIEIHNVPSIDSELEKDESQYNEKVSTNSNCSENVDEEIEYNIVRVSTNEIGIQCDLLRELWSDYTNQSKKKLTFFENFLNLISLSDKTESSDDYVEEEYNCTKPNTSISKFVNKIALKDTYDENKGPSTIGRVVDDLRCQDDADTMETTLESCSNSDSEEFYHQNVKESNFKNEIQNNEFKNKKYSKDVINLKSLINKKVCPVCSKEFRTEQSALDHLNIHTKKKPYKCSCGATFSHNTNFIWHLSRFLCPKEGAITPQYCQNKINENVQPKQIILTETFYCKICDIDFNGSKSDKHFSSDEHLTNENIWIRKYNVRKFICLECKMEFEMLVSLIRHRVKKHQKRISFLFFERLENFNLKYCYICDKSFIKRVNYIDHMNMHKKIYGYACSCGKKFQFYNSLVYHSQKRGCPVEGRILPTYCLKRNSSKIKKTKPTLNCDDNYEKLNSKPINENENEKEKSRRFINMTGTISNKDENSKASIVEEENLNLNTKTTHSLIPNQQQQMIYYPQIYNNDCLLDQNQILTLSRNQNNQIIPPQLMPGTLFVYEAIPQSNFIQLPQIVNISDIGHTIQLPLHTIDKHSQIDEDEDVNKLSNGSCEEYRKWEIKNKNIPDTTVPNPSTFLTENEKEVDQNIQQDISNEKLDSLAVNSDVKSKTNHNKESLSNQLSGKICQTKKISFYCDICRLNYSPLKAIKHLNDINHRKLEGKWRQKYNILKIKCSLCPRITFGKFFGLICHQLKVHGIKFDDNFFTKYVANAKDLVLSKKINHINKIKKS